MAQLDKAPDYESGDWGFKSLLGYKYFFAVFMPYYQCFTFVLGLGQPFGWMAERSKAPVSGTGLFGGVGSNPTPITVFVWFVVAVVV